MKNLHFQIVGTKKGRRKRRSRNPEGCVNITSCARPSTCRPKPADALRQRAPRARSPTLRPLLSRRRELRAHPAVLPPRPPATRWSLMANQPAVRLVVFEIAWFNDLPILSSNVQCIMNLSDLSIQVLNLDTRTFLPKTDVGFNYYNYCCKLRCHGCRTVLRMLLCKTESDSQLRKLIQECRKGRMD